ncbi:sulfite exporter TauE/SafE family protein [Erwinia oleae]|uniref:sulfite exporter TauE/SafE family protein n=1 Tax=Erwinia oleae TaxID=796334 RepID=UPI000552FDDA|nr:sulfite exporter TauE/SafE family protein [Erwinia oleae]
MSDIVIIALAGFATGMTTVLFGFGGGFVVVPFVYRFISHHGGDAVAGQAMHIAVATSTAVMVLNASLASYKNWKAGTLLAETLCPLIFFIVPGALLGALLAGALPDNRIRMLYILYMLFTVADCLLRKGFFMQREKKRLSSFTASAGGVIIGTVAALLGVGGSVMTVPLLRRHGYAMQHCISAANPLSVPVAVVASLVYIFSAPDGMPENGYLGYINLQILGLLIVTGFAGIAFTRKFIPPVPDLLHARIYILLLTGVTIAISL